MTMGTTIAWRSKFSRATATTRVSSCLYRSHRRNLYRCSGSSSSSFTPDTSDADDSSDADGPLHRLYMELVHQQGVKADPHQLNALKALERLRKELLLEQQPLLSSVPQEATAEEPFSFSGWLSSSSSSSSSSSQPSDTDEQTQSAFKKGVYLHGGVGCGKTFLAKDLFYASLRETPYADDRQWIHFHKFMLQVHQEMHIARYNNESEDSKPRKSDTILPAVIEKTLEKGRILCFDEFQVTDVADALILQRLFTGLFQRGCVVVATSNRPPSELYWNGLQRDRFLPFIDLLEERTEVVDMWESQVDYRLLQKANDDAVNANKVYFVGKDKYKQFDALFYKLVENTAVAPTSVTTPQGRKVRIPQAAMALGVARFSFEDLCQKALGAADYLMIGQHFHTVFVEKIPKLTLAEVNWIRRFIIFVDTMYESNVKLVLHAKAAADELFVRDMDITDVDEVFAFDRTLSRLEEMSSQTYLQKRWAGSETAKKRSELGSHVRVEPSL